MQIASGQAKVLSANHRRVQFVGMSAADAAALAAAQEFKFTGETLLYFIIASVISAVPASAEIELTADYNGVIAFDTLAAYHVTIDYTPNRGYKELAPGAVDIRDAFTANFRQLDAEIQDLYDTGGGGVGSGFIKQGIANVTAGAFTVTVTPPSGAFPTPPYGISPSANWPTTIGWSGQTTGQFVLTFGTEAPASAQVFWGVTEL